MQFIKTHLVSLICGVAALVFTAVGVMGMMSDSVQAKMQARLSEIGASEIASLRGDPKNPEIIEAERRRGEMFEAEYAQTVEEALAINRREPLMEQVFPEPQDAILALEYVQAFKAAVQKLPRQMLGGTTPDASDIEEERQNIIDLVLQEQEASGKQPTGAAQRPAGRPAPAPPGGSMRQPGGRFATDDSVEIVGTGRAGRVAPQVGEESLAPDPRSALPANIQIPTGQPKYDPVFRARVSKAKSIRVYYADDSFHVSPIIEAVSSLSIKPADLWYAQVSLWIQQDIVEAIAEVNRAASEERDIEEPYVEHSPVKRLERVRILGYQMAGKVLPFPARSVGTPGPSNLGMSFTNRTCNEQFDVVRFTVVAVVEQQAINEVIDAMSRKNFYQCVNLRYEPVSEADAAQGYLYGTQPVVRVTMDLELYMARAVYQTMMPPAVLTALGGTPEQPG